jgi:hypothetical protein
VNELATITVTKPFAGTLEVRAVYTEPNAVYEDYAANPLTQLVSKAVLVLASGSVNEDNGTIQTTITRN